VFVAVFIGAIEVLGLLGQDGNLTGWGWAWLENFNINTAGFVIVGVFVLTWAAAPVHLAFRVHRAEMGSRRRRGERHRAAPLPAARCPVKLPMSGELPGDGFSSPGR
jgi:hypothetical protein